MQSKVMFNNKAIPPFLDVISIKVPVLPQFEIVNNKIVWESREINIEVAFNKRGLIKPSEELELIKWVRGNNFEPCNLVLYNDKNNYYKARLDDNLKIEGLKRGKIDITFICDNPFKHSVNETVISNVTKLEKVAYNGTKSVYPILEIKVLKACTDIDIICTNSEGAFATKLRGNFNADDIVIINQANNHITINNNLRMGIWTLDSKRHKLVEGDNRYSTKNLDINVNIKFREMNL